MNLGYFHKFLDCVVVRSNRIGVESTSRLDVPNAPEIVAIP